MAEVLQEVLGQQVTRRSAFLSGPSFAREVAAEQPTAVTVAAEDLEVAQRVQEVFSTDYFRVYTNQDVVGVEIGGAMKNVRITSYNVCYTKLLRGLVSATSPQRG